MTADMEELRRRFPILEHTTYLATHSLGAVPRATREALRDYYDAWATQGILAWDGPWSEAVDSFSARIEALLGAEEGTVVPMQNATRAMAGIASCFDWDSERNKVVMTELEFTTSFPLWRQLEDLGAEVVVVEADEDGVTVDPERILAAVDKTTRVVHTSHVYFRSGAIQDLQALVAGAHREGAYVVADGYQAVGTIPVDVDALGVDFYVGGSHKWLCGGPGAGFMYVRPSVAGRLRPRLTGWFGLQDPFGYETDTSRGKPADGAKRFLGGTPNIPGLYAAREGIKVIQEVGMDAIRKRTTELSKVVADMATDNGYRLTGPEDPEDRSAMVCFDLDGARWRSERLSEQGVIVDARPEAGMRASPHFYNNEEDIVAFFDALEAL